MADLLSLSLIPISLAPGAARERAVVIRPGSCTFVPLRSALGYSMTVLERLKLCLGPTASKLVSFSGGPILFTGKRVLLRLIKAGSGVVESCQTGFGGANGLRASYVANSKSNCAYRAALFCSSMASYRFFSLFLLARAF